MNITTATSLNDLEQLNEQLAAGAKQGEQEMKSLRQQQSDVLGDLDTLPSALPNWLSFAVVAALAGSIGLWAGISLF